MAKRILVPLDRTSTSEAVLPFVSDLAHGAGSTVRLLRVEPVPNNVVSESGRVVAYTDQEMARLEAEGLAHLDEIATLLQGVPGERGVRFGDPASEILTEVDTFGAVRTALPTRGWGWLRHTRTGGIAARGFRNVVRRGYRVRDREGDADAADRGHRVGGVPDAEQAGPVPPAQAVDTDREQLHGLPIADLSLTTGGERREPHHIAAECLEPTLADLLA